MYKDLCEDSGRIKKSLMKGGKKGKTEVPNFNGKITKYLKFKLPRKQFRGIGQVIWE